MTARRRLTRADILAPEAYAKLRAECRRQAIAVKAKRRVEIGPFATIFFENYETMRHQVHEMLHVERGGGEQIEGELAAYNPLIPNGRELVATIMFEIENPDLRARVLGALGGIEETAFLEVDGAKVRGIAEGDVERTREDGKASSVQFVHFPFPPESIAAFRRPGARVVAGFDHPNYRNMAVLPEDIRRELAGDFD